MRNLNAETPTAATMGASKVHWNPVTRILARLSASVNRFPPLALYRELQAARSLVNAYEATDSRRARQRQLMCSGVGRKGGQR
jgi:hypothetical protein